ncbi:MAG: hypothetical protein RL033_2307 [Pseudomonadota bacterium]
MHFAMRSIPACLAALLLTLFWSASSPAEPAPLGMTTGAQSPEDLLQIPRTPWIVVSAMRSKHTPGRLLLIDSRKPQSFLPLYPAEKAVSGGPPPATFAPHGVSLRSLDARHGELLAIDHDGDFVDRFSLRVAGDVRPSIERVIRLALPPGCSGNSVTAMPNGGIAVTCMSDPKDAGFLDKFIRGEATGAAFCWSQARGWRRLSPPMSAANGIAVSADGKTLFVTEWAARKLWRIPLESGEPNFVPTPFLPDNLRWTDAGKLLLVGQTSDPRALFSCQEEHRSCPMGYVVAEVDPTSLSISTLLTGTEEAYAASGFGSGTGAIQVGDTLWVGTFLGDRIARFAMPK